MSGYSTRLDDAVALTLDAFRPVVRKQTHIPYITHLFGVMALVGEYGGDEDQLIAAVLHDFLEDIEESTEVGLRARFGERVARIVVQCTDTEVLPKPPWRRRKERHLAKVLGLPDDTRLVMCADKLHNCQTLVRDVRLHGQGVFDRFNGGRDGTLWYYREMHTALGMGWRHPILDEFGRWVDALEEVAGVLR
ncbi:MAG: HD domain-containing protein [Deltaproteobacteria bacterium]|nr:MAG: HD domain-containing protein [Deltaproteobacteria bacterium]